MYYVYTSVSASKAILTAVSMSSTFESICIIYNEGLCFLLKIQFAFVRLSLNRNSIILNVDTLYYCNLLFHLTICAEDISR